MTEQEWLRAYAVLILRLDRRLAGTGRGWEVDYFGPDEWRARVAEEEPRPAGRLVDDADELATDLPFDEPRRGYLAAHVRALRALARQEAGARLAMPDLVRECLGIEVGMVPETVFEQAHDELDRALPRTAGSLATRLHDWRTAHSLPRERLDQLPDLVALAVAECRARTHQRIVPLPDGERTGCELVAGVGYVGVGAHHGGLDSTILLNGDRPFNLADLLYVVAHEGHPGHIAEMVLKEIHLADRGRVEQRVRFAPAPPFVLSEGLALHAQALVFPGDEAQAWLADNILGPRGIRPDGSDFAAVHRARNAMFGVRHNALLLVDEGRSDTEVAEYLSRWGLVENPTTSGLDSPYLSAYYHGWRLLDSRLDSADLARRLLTEQVLPTDLATTES
ncbi:MAG: hypothetical protein ACRDSK_26630 [Actinophytocola sp.]|uniref:hypothetical protein n=1 Tax=Actinophytocola sp. TaxID=1872138 RepID=UPI003D6C6C35